MRIDELNLTGKKARSRKGRGISAGQGKTAGRGTKGQNARSGGSLRPGFEGGQNPLIQRVPKLAGFKSRRQPVQTVRLADLELITGKTITNKELHNRGLISSATLPVKVVASGQISKAKTVKLQAVSKQALKLIEQAGGSFITTKKPSFTATTAKSESTTSNSEQRKSRT